MRASAWHDGGGTYGVRVGMRNRDAHFDPTWAEIEVEVEGRFYRFTLTPGFWHKCPEFRDRGTPILQEWLRRHYTIDWPKGEPPRFGLVPLGRNRFRLTTAEPKKSK